MKNPRVLLVFPRDQRFYWLIFVKISLFLSLSHSLTYHWHGNAALQVINSYRHFPSPINDPSLSLAIDERKEGEREKGCFVARSTTSTLRLTLMLVDIDIRRASSRRPSCVTFNLSRVTLSLAYCKSSDPEVYLSTALATRISQQEVLKSGTSIGDIACTFRD